MNASEAIQKAKGELDEVFKSKLKINDLNLVVSTNRMLNLEGYLSRLAIKTEEAKDKWLRITVVEVSFKHMIISP